MKDWLTVLVGDCREQMRTLEPASVNCVVTSPPYWGLRDYGTAGQLGLEATPELYVAAMVDVFRAVRRVLRDDGTVWLNLGSSYFNAGPSGPQGQTGQRASRTFTAEGLGSGAVGASGRSQSPAPERAPACGTDGTGPLGYSAPDCACSGLCDGCLAARSSRSPGTHQPTPAGASLPSLTGRDSGHSGSAPASPDASPLASQASTQLLSEPLPLAACSHCGNCGACLSVLRSPLRDARLCVRRTGDTPGTTQRWPTSDARTAGREPSGLAWGDYTSTLKPKDMVPIPWMVAMALQADGWFLRSEIIWAKPNPMPESVTDRPTKAHEYVFLLTKSARYWYDDDAVREPMADASEARYGYSFGGPKAVHLTAEEANGAGTRTHPIGDRVPGTGRNLRSVWNIATHPYPGAHFATFPEALVVPCVKAGCPDKVCSVCGAPWQRQVERTTAERHTGGGSPAHSDLKGYSATSVMRTNALPVVTTTGWLPTCTHDAPTVPGVVMDPFAGTGTVGVVANRLSRRAILIDLNPDYIDQLQTRNQQAPMGLTA